MNRDKNVFIVTDKAILAILLAIVAAIILLAATNKGTIRKVKFNDAEVEFGPTDQAEQPRRTLNR